MSIRYECEHCGSVLKIKEDLAGKPGKCPKCKTAFTVPAASSEPDSSGELAATEAPEDAAPLLATSESGGANDDFDLDAFLMDDGDAAPKDKAAKSRVSKSSPPADPGASDLDDGGGDSDDEEGFAIRRGPDAPAKRAKALLMPGLDGDDVDESPTPSRRPPGTNPNAPASNVASDLLSKSAKKGKKTSWDEVQPEKREESEFDWAGLRREVLLKGLPAVAGLVVVCWLLFKLVNSAMGTRQFVPPLGQVRGTVTINAQPLVGAQVIFYPESTTMKSGDKEYRITASMGMTDASGHYELSYSDELKGAVIGPCKVQIVAAGRSDVAAQYLGEKPTATQTVKKGKQTIDLELSK
jgi:hypothetical protein